MIENSIAHEVVLLEELKGIIQKTIQVRQVTLVAFFTIALLVKLFFALTFPITLFLAPLVWFLLTFPFERLIKSCKGEATLHKIHAGFFAIELLVITYLIHLMGGVEWIGLIFYIFTIIYANFFLPPREGYFTTGWAVLLYSSLVLLEYFGLIPHRTLFSQLPHFKNFAYVIITILAGMIGIYAILSCTIRIFANVYLEKNEALRAQEQELRILSLRLIEAQEEERRRISRELHDELGQALTAIKLNLGLMEGTFPSNSPMLAETVKLIQAALKKTRELAIVLWPPMLDELGLVPALRHAVKKFQEATDIEVALRVEGLLNNRNRLSPQLEILLYRAVQESLANISKHAQARKVAIHLKNKDTEVELVIKDDGVGFDVEEVLKCGTGLGLRSMKEQVGLLGGTFKINSYPQKGTEVYITIPSHKSKSLKSKTCGLGTFDCLLWQ